ncbi:MAG: Serine/threonine-protein kinase pkn3 [Labilithrix sp.]|nr:Serine/threonine-protein kinase pkn3 [Labilithrix sp.]
MAAADRIGSVIASKYRLEELLGEGGMGAVFRAKHLTVGKRFAIKLLHASVSDHPDAKRRFTREAQAAARIGHPAILDVYDLGEDGGSLYMVMALLEGESLAQRVSRGPLPITEAIQYALGVLEALEAAHGASIIHRDIKPANVFLVAGATGREAVRVLDFGIAKFQEAGDGTQTSTGAVLGSAYYMAPEQVRAESEIDARADVWGVGALLYELLVGEPAHMAPTHAAVIAKIVMKPAPPLNERRPDADAKIDAIVARALAIDPAKRFASAGEMREALETYVVERAATVISVPPPARSPSADRGPSSGTPRGVIAATTDLRPLSAPARARSLIALAAAALVLSVVATAAIVNHRSAPPSPSQSSSPPPPPPIASLPSADPIPIPVPVPVPVPVLLSPSASASAIPRRPPPPSRAATCGPSEILSDGHCCPRGFVWRDDHCERDIAVDAPF